MKKGMGPKIEPWRAPVSVFCKLDFLAAAMTYCVRCKNRSKKMLKLVCLNRNEQNF